MEALLWPSCWQRASEALQGEQHVASCNPAFCPDHHGWMSSPVSSSKQASPPGKDARARRNSSPRSAEVLNCSRLNCVQKTVKDRTWFKKNTSEGTEGMFSADGIKHPFLQRTGVIHLGECLGAAQYRDGCYAEDPEAQGAERAW